MIKQLMQASWNTARHPKKFPRNTYVCIADDINDIFDNMGDYYEQKMNKENHEDGEPIITLGTLLDDYTNETHGAW